MSRLDEIKERWAKATPGPWSDFCESGDWWIEPATEDGSPRNTWAISAESIPTEDMLAIAASPADVSFLLDLADALARLVETEPLARNTLTYRVGCVYCQRREHAPDCPWRQARELLNSISAVSIDPQSVT